MRSITIRWFCAALAVALAPVALAPAALAQKGGMNVPEHATRPVVMELFSSQGCGNCPAANANIAKLSERADVIALTYPVGYWDYLGWNDTFAKPEFAARQTRYNRVLRHRGPYTPQVVYSGRLHGSGVNLAKIEEKFAIRDITPYPATVSFDKDGVVVAAAPASALKPEDKASVVLIRFTSGTTRITPGGGANKGKPMTYVNLVTGYEVLGEWKGGTQKYPAKCVSGCAVLVQRAGAEGLIIGAAQKK